MSNQLNYFVHCAESESTIKKVEPTLLIQHLDLTSLNTTDDELAIQALCQKATKYKPAAVCVYPAFVQQAAQALAHTDIKVATVANFPAGTRSLKVVLSTIEKALRDGATELDVVIPYQTFLTSHNKASLKKFVENCKALLPEQSLKVILETGAFYDDEILETAALACLEGGANFLKTSTGKISQGANLMAAAVLLRAIQNVGDMTRGLKISGGVRHYTQAKAYYILAIMMMNENWPSKDTFRIGASSLLDELIQR